MFIKFAARFLVWVALASLFSLLTAAQQTTPAAPSDTSAQVQTQTPAQTPPQDQPAPAAHQPPADKDKDKPAEASKDGKNQDSSTGGKVPGTSNSRLLVLPNFLTLENGGHPPPLTWKQKYHAVALGTFDPVQYPWWGFLAGLDQAANSDRQLGQGWKGYAKRYGLVAGDGIIENFMVQAVFPSVLRQDPRFFQTSDGSFVHRAGYAIGTMVVTRGDSGHKQFNASEILGAGFAAAIATYSYHPKSAFISTPTNPHQFVASDRTFMNFASTWGTQVSLDTMTIVIKEFWPDIRRKVLHKKQVNAGSTPPPVSKP